MKDLFEFEPAEDQSTDDQWVLNSNWDIAVQVCPYDAETPYTVTRAVKISIDDFALEGFGSYATLEQAMSEAVKLNNDTITA